jgi:Family of unknown function (DUF5715)
MTKNPIFQAAIALAIPALMSFGTPDKGTCATCKKFDDGAAKHKEVAKTSSIGGPVKNYSVLKNYVSSNKLVKLNSGNGYLVSKMNYSYPYVTVKAHQFIEELGQAYIAKCKETGVAYLPFIITSATRTKETVAKLTRVNKNAIPESAHLYGTTVDISWVRFGTEQKHSQKNLNVLIDVLMDMRDKEACFVKFERMQACFHITVNESKVGIDNDNELINQMAAR